MTTTEKKSSYELLEKYGACWTVLTAMEVDLMKKGVLIPTAILKELEVAHIKISSGCFSTCETHCSLSKIEGGLISIATKYGDDYLEHWYELLGQAMQGKVDLEKISNIPLLKPVETSCSF